MNDDTQINQLRNSPELREFSERNESTKTIARRYGISPSTLTARAKRAGLPLRKRGRWQLPEPTAKQKRILRLVRTGTYAEVGSKFGMSKQRVSQVVRRWGGRTHPKGREVRKNRRQIPRVVSFRVDHASYECLRELLKHPWFKRLGSTGGAAREIVYQYLAGVFPENRFLDSACVVNAVNERQP
jgi:DNA-binding CsgD family transcriptional regulator